MTETPDVSGAEADGNRTAGAAAQRSPVWSSLDFYAMSEDGEPNWLAATLRNADALRR